jgi:hypothetical protein
MDAVEVAGWSMSVEATPKNLRVLTVFVYVKAKPLAA